jgi:hypothetical protein
MHALSKGATTAASQSVFAVSSSAEKVNLPKSKKVDFSAGSQGSLITISVSHATGRKATETFLSVACMTTKTASTALVLKPGATVSVVDESEPVDVLAAGYHQWWGGRPALGVLGLKRESCEVSFFRLDDLTTCLLPHTAADPARVAAIFQQVVLGQVSVQVSSTPRRARARRDIVSLPLNSEPRPERTVAKQKAAAEAEARKKEEAAEEKENKLRKQASAALEEVKKLRKQLGDQNAAKKAKKVRVIIDMKI